MSRPFVVLVVAAAAVLLITSSPAAAQPWSQQGSYDYYRPAPPTYYYPAPGSEETQSFYPSTAVAEPVFINVVVPANAEIRFNGARTSQTGSNRRFFSPPIAAGSNYFYVVEASWMENGRQVTRSRRVAVRAGDVLTLTFGPGDVRLNRAN
jgi:uncharacterized protein (TIGR03000 family)